MFSLNLKICKILAVLIVCTFIIHTTEAGYTSEEIDEQSKSLYKAESSILASTENNKHQHKHTYYGSPCASGSCPGAFSPCSNPSGCAQPTAPVFSNGMVHSINSGVASIVPGYGAGYTVNSGQGNITPPPQIPYTGVSGYAAPLPYQVPNGAYGAANNIHSSSVNGAHYTSPSQQPSQNGYAGYTQPTASSPYPHWNSHPSHYGYQGPRGYSVYDHSLKLNTEYTETGTHTGPLQRSNNGYGSGYGGGYNGLFNRPGF